LAVSRVIIVSIVWFVHVSMGIEYNRMRVLKGKDNPPNSCVDMRVPPKMGILGASLLRKENKERKNARQNEVANINVRHQASRATFSPRLAEKRAPYVRAQNAASISQLITCML
jgi:hypothetical protein